MMKKNLNDQSIMTDAFLRESYNPDLILQHAVKTSIKEQELKPVTLEKYPSFIAAIRAARRKSRKIFSKKLCIRLIGICMILLGFFVLFTSCKYADSPIEISAEGFYTENDSSANDVEYIQESKYKKYQSPIVGIIHPYESINDNKSKSENNTGLDYELSDKTTITEVDTDDSLLQKINQALKQNDDREARKLISTMILQDNISPELEIKLLMHLREINSRLLQSSDANGDSKLITVQKGDTVWRIAQQNKTTPEAIGMLNQIDVNKIQVGQKLKIFKSGFNLIVNSKRSCVYLWQDDHVVKRYDAKINNLTSGSYRLKAQKKGTEASIYYSGDIVLAPTGFQTTIPKTIKIDSSDYSELVILLVSDSILQVK